jgi:hypothetical protein
MVPVDLVVLEVTRAIRALKVTQVTQEQMALEVQVALEVLLVTQAL